MNGFIFGFQRLVWCPKWTPASSKSFNAMPLKLPPRLSLAVLEAFARSLLTVLLAFLDARVAGQEARLLQPLPQVDVELDQRPGDAQAQRPGVAGDAAAGNGRQHVELIRGFRHRHRLLDLRAQRLG